LPAYKATSARVQHCMLILFLVIIASSRTRNAAKSST